PTCAAAPGGCPTPSTFSASLEHEPCTLHHAQSFKTVAAPYPLLFALTIEAAVPTVHVKRAGRHVVTSRDSQICPLRNCGSYCLWALERWGDRRAQRLDL